MSWWSAIFSAVGGATGAALVVSWVARRYVDHQLQERLQRLSHEHTAAIEKQKGEQQSALEDIKLVEQRMLVQLNAAMATHATTHNATTAKRVEAIESLWAAVVELRRWPDGLSMIDIVTAEEYRSLPITHEKQWSGLAKTCTEYIETRHPPQLVRPFVGEGIWQRYLGYWQFMLRVAIVTSGYVGKRKHPWYEDQPTLRLLGAILGKEDYERVQAAPFYKLRTTTDLLDLAILTEIDNTLSGRRASSESLDRVRSIMNEIAAVSEESRNDHS